MSAEDRILCEKFLQDPTTNPRTGTRLIKDKGPYNNYVKLCHQFGLADDINSSTKSTKAPEKSQTKISITTKTPIKASTLIPIKSLTRTTETPIKASTMIPIKNLTQTTMTSANQIHNLTPTSLNMNKNFTGIPDTDLIILLNTNSIEDIVNMYNTSKYFRNLLNQPSSWHIIQQYFKLFQSNNFQELVILKQELKKCKAKYKIYRRNEISDFRCGDRVIIASKPENYVVVDIKSPNMTLQQVDMFGKTLSDKLMPCKLQGNKKLDLPWAWYYEDHEKLEIIFGINNEAGYCIKSLSSPCLVYKTLPSEMQHGKPIEIDMFFSLPPINRGAEYVTKLATIPSLMNNNGTINHIGYRTTQVVPGFKPELGMLVEVLSDPEGLSISSMTNIYYIEAMEHNKLLFKIVPELSPDYGSSQIPDTIIAIKKDDSWHEENIGTYLNLIFGSGYVHNYYVGSFHKAIKLLLFYYYSNGYN
jgi:hypothetical protein